MSEDQVSALPELYSPSRMADFNQCPRLFYYKTILKLPTPPSMATLRGTLAHYAYEKTFDIPEGERSWQESVKLVDEAWAELTRADYEEGSREHRDAVQAVEIAPEGSEQELELLETSKEMVKNWFEMERVNNFTPTALPLPDGQLMDGREVYVKEKVGKVPMHGYIDRVDAWTVGDEHAWSISDYKGLALDTALLTTSGWTTMADIQVGSELYGSDGQPTRVVGKSEIHSRPCYRLEFSDGASIVSDNVHLWQVLVDGMDGHRVEVVVSTQDLAKLAQAGPVELAAPTCTLSSPVLNSHELGECAYQALLGQIRKVSSVTEVDSVPTQCVSVEAHDQLYFAGRDMVLTHNTGKLPAPRYRDKYFDQLRIYSVLLKEQYGVQASVLRLVFTKTADRVNGILTEPVTQARMKAISSQVSRTYDEIRRCAQSGQWPTKTGPLCNWCFFQDVCPAWNKGTDGLAVNADGLSA